MPIFSSSSLFCLSSPSSCVAPAEDDGNIASGARPRGSSTNLCGHPTTLASLVHLFLPPLRMPTARRRRRKIEGSKRCAQPDRQPGPTTIANMFALFRARPMPIFNAHVAFATSRFLAVVCSCAVPLGDILFFVCLSAQVFDEFVPELLLDPVPLLEVVPQNGDLANLKE